MKNYITGPKTSFEKQEEISILTCYNNLSDRISFSSVVFGHTSVLSSVFQFNVTESNASFVGVNRIWEGAIYWQPIDIDGLVSGCSAFNVSIITLSYCLSYWIQKNSWRCYKNKVSTALV